MDHIKLFVFSVLKNKEKQFSDQRVKHVGPLKVLKPDVQYLSNKDVTPEDQLNEEAKNEIERMIAIVKNGR